MTARLKSPAPIIFKEDQRVCHLDLSEETEKGCEVSFQAVFAYLVLATPRHFPPTTNNLHNIVEGGPNRRCMCQLFTSTQSGAGGYRTEDEFHVAPSSVDTKTPPVVQATTMLSSATT